MADNNNSQPAENYAQEITFILFKRIRLIVTTIVLVSAASIIIGHYWPPVYSAHSSILIKRQRIDKHLGSLEQMNVRTFPLNENNLQSERLILTSEELLAETVDDMSRRGKNEAVLSLGDGPAERVSNLKAVLSARVVPTSNVIEVVLSGSNGPVVLEVLQTMLRIYPDFRERVFKADGAVSFLAMQVDRLRRALARKNDEVSAFVERTGLSSADHQIEANLGLRRDLKSSLASLSSTMGDVNGEVGYLNDLLAQPNVARFTGVRLSDGTVLSGRSEVIARVRQQRARLEVMRDNSRLIGERIRELDEANLALRRNQLTYQMLEREVVVLGAAYQTLLTRYNEARITNPKAKIPGTEVSLLVSPRLSDDQLPPGPKTIILVGLLAGVVLGISLAFIREFFDRTFARAEEVQRVLGMPVLFSIPDGVPMDSGELHARARSGVLVHRPLREKAVELAIFLLIFGAAVLLPANAMPKSLGSAPLLDHAPFLPRAHSADLSRPHTALRELILEGDKP